MSPQPQDVKGFRLLHDALTRAAADDDFRLQLLADPEAVLRKEGLHVPDGVKLVVHENTDHEVHLAVPSRAREWDELDVDDVDVRLMTEVGF